MSASVPSCRGGNACSFVLIRIIPMQSRCVYVRLGSLSSCARALCHAHLPPRGGTVFLPVLIRLRSNSRPPVFRGLLCQAWRCSVQPQPAGPVLKLSSSSRPSLPGVELRAHECRSNNDQRDGWHSRFHRNSTNLPVMLVSMQDFLSRALVSGTT